MAEVWKLVARFAIGGAVVYPLIFIGLSLVTGKPLELDVLALLVPGGALAGLLVLTMLP